MKKTRTKHTPAFKAKVALEAVREQQSIPELSRRYGVHANQIYKWKREFIERAALAFGSEAQPVASTEREEELLAAEGGSGEDLADHEEEQEPAALFGIREDPEVKEQGGAAEESEQQRGQQHKVVGCGIEGTHRDWASSAGAGVLAALPLTR